MQIDTDFGKFSLTLNRDSEGNYMLRATALESEGQQSMDLQVFPETTIGEIIEMGRYMAEFMNTDFSKVEWAPFGV